MSLRKTSEYGQVSVEQTLELLESSTRGLTESEARNRVDRYGLNEVVEKEKDPVIEFLSRYWGPMPWLLELAMALSYVLGHYLELAIIFSLLTINAVIGFVHTRSSRRALDLLKRRMAVRARVLRNGEWTVQDARELVPGDIIGIGLGDLVPADAKILADGELVVDQSALTGESFPITVHESGIVYSSSVVKRGEARGLVVNTGTNTYFGRTAQLVKIAKPVSHQEQMMMAVVKYMMYVSFAALAIVAADSALVHADFPSLLNLTLTFLLGAVPVALPAVFAVVLSVGAIELSKKGALVTRLDSIEDAASMEVLLLDKTGTITQNRLSITEPIPFPRFKKDDVVLFASLASREETKDTIDLTVIQYAKAAGINSSAYKQVSFTPFEPATKRSEAIIDHEGRRFKVAKGAPQVIISRCHSLGEEIRAEANRNVEELSERGYRTIAVAISDADAQDSFQLVGLLPLADPPRPDSKRVIEALKALGVKMKMLTGDNIAVAREIARQVRIGDKIHRVSDLKNASETQQAKILDEYDGLAEIYPEDKYKVVKLLQSRGHMVGMTGDGVNDAPALKQAEVGIAVSNSTDVAKESASIVLTQPGTQQIIEAIRTSRQIYQRMLTWVINKVSKVVQFVGLLVLGYFWLQGAIVSVLGMVLVVFANDFVTMSLATDNVSYTSSPNLWNVRKITLASLVIGLPLVAGGAVAIFVGIEYFALKWGELQSYVMLMLVFTSQFRVYIVRERRRCWSSRPGRELLIASIATVTGFALLGLYGIIMPPLTVTEVLFILGFSAAFTLSLDFPKYQVFRRLGL
ncbi:MAG TPA: plasma-membrane proton-efflux P-type ATPase [Candidatus Acidoferrum sp.]|nr:plasma-membrane proton-efflux P-type ATPase [Candidatus Acidoferrum sp.]